jgi:hypothetical protein
MNIDLIKELEELLELAANSDSNEIFLDLLSQYENEIEDMTNDELIDKILEVGENLANIGIITDMNDGKFARYVMLVGIDGYLWGIHNRRQWNNKI